MRRSDREVSDTAQIEEIISDCRVCHLAMIDGDKPYVVPLSFGYELTGSELTLFFHSAREGRKLDILQKNSRVCFEMCAVGEPIYSSERPCSSGYASFASVIGEGRVEVVESEEEKCRALSLLLKRHSGKDVRFSAEQSRGVCVLKLAATRFTAKRKLASGRKEG